MKYRANDIDRIAKQITQMIEADLVTAGIFYRIFFRCKTFKSLTKKLGSPNEDGSLKYDSHTKRLQDVIGVRVNLYFVDDLELITDFIKSKYGSLFEDETIDKNTTTEFKPTRINLIFRIPEQFLSEFRQIVSDHRVDSTFELQLRTVHSEGWHEIEHDLRYKCQDDWTPYPEMSRMFNGYLAALETQEWSMIQLFNDISHKHYKTDNINGLLKTKLRIRFDDHALSPTIEGVINSNQGFKRELSKINRINVIELLLYKRPLIPMTLDNVIFLINYFILKDTGILELTPEPVMHALQQTSPAIENTSFVKTEKVTSLF